MTSSCHSGRDLLKKMGVRLRYLSFLSSANVVSKPQWIYVVIVPLVSPHPWPRFSQHELHLMPILPSRAICTMLLADFSPAPTTLSTTIRPAHPLLTGEQTNFSWQLPTYPCRSLAQPPAERGIRQDEAAMNHTSYSTPPSLVLFLLPTTGLRQPSSCQLTSDLNLHFSSCKSYKPGSFPPPQNNFLFFNQLCHLLLPFSLSTCCTSTPGYLFLSAQTRPYPLPLILSHTILVDFFWKIMDVILWHLPPSLSLVSHPITMFCSFS